MGFSIDLQSIPQKVVASIEAELPSRAIRATNELISAKNEVLSGGRSGRIYGGHQASAPGEPPANWTGQLRDTRWRQIDDAHCPAIESDTWYAMLLEGGTPGGQMAPRPFRDAILEKAIPNITAIYSEPWHIKL